MDRRAAFAGDGREWRARVDEVARDGLRATVGEVARQEPASPLVVEVWCALVRSQRFEWAIEKCVEAGADIIRPLICEHSARGDAPSTAKQERWERIAVEAAEQCGRLRLAVVERPARLESLLGRGVPVFFGENGVGHSGTFWSAPNGGQYADVAVAWMSWQLKGDASASRMFRGKDCGLCVDPRWSVRKKRIDAHD